MKKLFTTFIAIICVSLGVSAQNTGIGTTTPDTSAKLEVNSTTQGFLPPRMTTAQRDAIASPAEGLWVYNLDTDCMNYYNNATNSWKELCGTVHISATPCTPTELISGINGGSLGNKYANGAGGTYSVVNIGDQCWMDENIDVNPAGSPAWANFTDVGWYGYYNNSYQAVDEGTLLQWSAAMSGSTTERAQGVCPTGWHVPSDREFMYLENTLGMSVAQQQATNWRGTDQGTQLKVGGTSQYEGILAGYRSSVSSFHSRGSTAYYWSSSKSGGDAYTRGLNISVATVFRNYDTKAAGMSLRCLKD